MIFKGYKALQGYNSVGIEPNYVHNENMKGGYLKVRRRDRAQLGSKRENVRRGGDKVLSRNF